MLEFILFKTIFFSSISQYVQMIVNTYQINLFHLCYIQLSLMHPDQLKSLSMLREFKDVIFWKSTLFIVGYAYVGWLNNQKIPDLDPFISGPNAIIKQQVNLKTLYLKSRIVSDRINLNLVVFF